MQRRLNILHLEDDRKAAELVRATIEAEGIECAFARVETSDGFVSALEHGGFDLILADYFLASVDGFSALRIAKEKCPDTPFIVVSGELGEDAGIECLKLGATDYVHKRHIARLIPRINRALQEADDAKARQITETQMRVQSTALKAASNAIVITDRQGLMVWVNPAFSKLTGFSSQEAVGQTPRLLKSGIYDRRFYQDLWKTILSGQVWSGEMINRRKDGTLYTEEQSITPVKNDGGEISHFIAIKQDITERKQMEQALRARDVAESANRTKGEFLANMSHELRTPLNAIIGFTQMMHDEKLGPVTADQKEYLDDVLNSADHLLRLIDDILDLTKVDTGKMDFKPEPLDLQTVVLETCDTARAMAAKKRVRIEAAVDPTVCSVYLDPGRLKQVLYNYLSNAVKFTPDGGCVTVRGVPEGREEFRVEVTDTGIGIDADDIGRLFVEFQQLNTSVAKRYPGTGLGLALTKKSLRPRAARSASPVSSAKGALFMRFCRGSRAGKLFVIHTELEARCRHYASRLRRASPFGAGFKQPMEQRLKIWALHHRARRGCSQRRNWDIVSAI